MFILQFTVISCSSKNNNSLNNQTKLTDEYHALKLSLDPKFENIEDCSILDDNNLLLAVRDKNDNGLKTYLSDYSLNNFKEIKFENTDTNVEICEIKSSGNGRIFIFCTNNSADSGEIAEAQAYKLVEIDTEGSVVSETELDLGEYSEETESVSEMLICDDQFIFKCINHNGVTYLVTDGNGKAVGKLEYKLSNYIQSICILNDGRVAALGQKGVNPVLSFYDCGNMNASDTVILDNLTNERLYAIIAGSGDINCYIASDSAIYGLNKNAQIKETLKMSNIVDYNLQTVIPQENNEYIVIGRHSDDNQSCVYRLIRFTDEEMNNTKVINIAVLGNDTDISDMVNDFNKTHTNFRLKIINYENGMNDFENSLNGVDNWQFKQDIITGDTPDMLFSKNRSTIVQMAKKGLFTDLYSFLDNDDALSKDAIMNNVLKASEVNGKLPSISPYFTITTMAAKKKWINKENWTVDDAVAVYDSMPENMKFLQTDSREEISEMLFYVTANYIDIENGKCDFENSEFRKFMKFADKFKPISSNSYDMNSQANEDSGTDYINDKTLLAPFYLTDFRDYLTNKAILFGEDDICFVGFPSNNNKGANLNLSMNLSIFENSENKEICWEFIKSAFKECELSELLDIGEFPSLKSNFNKLADDITKIPVYENEIGEKEEKPLTINVNGKSVALSPLTESEKEAYVIYISGIYYDKMVFPPEIMNIIAEEIQPWIYGDITSDEFIDAIQSHISIFLSEQY